MREATGVLAGLHGGGGVGVVTQVVELVEARHAERCRIDEVRPGASAPFATTRADSISSLAAEDGGNTYPQSDQD